MKIKTINMNKSNNKEKETITKGKRKQQKKINNNDHRCFGFVLIGKKMVEMVVQTYQKG